MYNPFDENAFFWVKYSGYELKKAENEQMYITPAQDSKLTPYDPDKEPEKMILDALNAGLVCINRKKKKSIQVAVMDFISKYGLLGIMTALPTTPEFANYDTAFIPHNHFIKEETLPSHVYASTFYPFDQPDIKKGEDGIMLSATDNELTALIMTTRNIPMGIYMSFIREYSEPYDWIVTQLRDMAFTFMTSVIYYEDYDNLDEETRSLYRRGTAAFGGIAPTYRIALKDKPVIVWEFFSLLRNMQMKFSFMLTDEKKPLRMCKHCEKAFLAGHVSAVFCSPKCKNQFNVYKNRRKKNDTG